MLEAGCDGTEVASSIGIHEDTLYNACESDHKMGFSAYKAAKRATGDQLLKSKQFEVAMSGDRTMLVWLGKQRLGQVDKKNVDHTTGGDKLPAPVQVMFIGSNEELPQSEDDIVEPE